MKAISKFFVKGIYLILVIIAISIVINQIISVNQIGTADLETIKFRKDADNILETLVGSEKCLAMKNNNTIEKIINISTLDEFQSKYPDIEPDCARDYEYGYNIKIEKFNFTKFIGKSWEPKIPPGNRDIVLILDNSFSMSNPPIRFEMAQSAAKQLVKCADKSDRVAIVIFGNGPTLYCDVKEKIPMTPLSTQQNINNIINEIDNFDANYGTPLIDSLRKAEEIIKNEGNSSKFRMIILFTDGRETCCNACTGTKGTSDCLNPCKNELCDFSNSDLSFLKSNNIPIYSIFLGNDSIGIKQTECVSEQTGGKFYNISDDDIEILPKMFCQIVAKERDSGEDYQVWYFGSKNHSIDEALKDYITISIPVSIKISETKTQPGLATIKLYKGELEELTGLIDNTCETGLEIRKNIYITYPVKINGNSICMDNLGKINCRKFACNLNVDFKGINTPGMYEFYVKKVGDTVKVIV